MPLFFDIPEKPTPRRHSQGLYDDPVKRSQTPSGKYITETRSTAVPRTRRLFYLSVSQSSKNAIETWEKDVVGFGGQSFNWKDPNRLDPVQYVAKLAGTIDYNIHPDNPERWQVSFDLVLVAESSSSSSLSSSSSSSSSSSFSSSSSSSFSSSSSSA